MGLISPILIILVFSLMFFLGICAAMIDPAGEASAGIERIIQILSYVL